MGRQRAEPCLDPMTGKQLPPCMRYRGISQYSARKCVYGKRLSQTFPNARLATNWLADLDVDRRRGTFFDPTGAEQNKLGDLIARYQREVLGEDSEKRGAEKEKSHLKIVRTDEMCRIWMSRLTSANISEFRNRMKAAGYARATIVRRLNLVQTVIEHARREWRVHLSVNPAQLVRRPVGADRRRDRIFVLPTPGAGCKSEEQIVYEACYADSAVRFALLSQRQCDKEKSSGYIGRTLI